MFEKKNVVEYVPPGLFRVLTSLWMETTQLKETLEPADFSWLHVCGSEKLNPLKIISRETPLSHL